METEAGDVCAWCKRPLGRRSLYGSFDYVREGESLSLTDRMVPILGAGALVLFLGLIAYALIKSNPSKPEVVASMSGSNGPSVIQTGPMANSTPAKTTTQPYVAPKSTPVIPQPTAWAPASQPANNPNVMARPEPIVPRDPTDHPLALTEARFQVGRTKEGRYVLYGEVDLDNATNDPIRSARFVLTVNHEDILLHVYSGDITQPTYIDGPEIIMGRTTAYLMNADVSPSLLKAGARKLTVDGKTAEGKTATADILVR
jgi:hypothetical protein